MTVQEIKNRKSLNKNKEIYVPDIGTDEMEVTDILVKIGDKVRFEQSLITIEGNKASIEIPAPFEGIIRDIKVNIGSKINTGMCIIVLEVANEEVDLHTTENQDTTEIKSPITISNTDEKNNNTITLNVTKENLIHATPSIYRLAREFGIDLFKIQGTGRKGRILREDIQKYIRNIIQQKINSTSDTKNNNLFSSLPTLPIFDFKKFGHIQEIELNKIQKISASNLYRNWITIPHVTQFDEVDITELEEFRNQQNINTKNEANIKITLLAFIVKIVAKALEKFPYFNSSLSADAQKLILKKYINVSVAIDTAWGLVVPVLRDINKKNILEIASELLKTIEKAHSNKLLPLDMQGGCFTISNLGGLSGTAFTPIVNAPEVAILGISKSYIKPIWKDNEFYPRLVLPLSLSYDHRVINGMDGIKFIKFLGEMISDIRLLVI